MLISETEQLPGSFLSQEADQKVGRVQTRVPLPAATRDDISEGVAKGVPDLAKLRLQAIGPIRTIASTKLRIPGGLQALDQPGKVVLCAVEARSVS